MRYLWNQQQNSVVGTMQRPPPPHCSSAEEIESDSCGVSNWHCSLSLPSSAGMVGSRCCCPLRAGSHCGVVLGKKRGLLCCQVAVVGRDSYGFVFPPRVTASAAPFAPLTGDPTPQPNGPNPGSNPCFSHMSMCVFAQALAVFAGPGQSDWLAQMWQAYRNVRNAEALERACPSLARGRGGTGLLSIGRQFSSALLCWPTAGPTDWLESMVSAASLLEMACSTFMVIALTRAFWRPRTKECVKKTGLVSPVIMCLDTLTSIKPC